MKFHYRRRMRGRGTRSATVFSTLLRRISLATFDPEVFSAQWEHRKQGTAPCQPEEAMQAASGLASPRFAKSAWRGKQLLLRSSAVARGWPDDHSRPVKPGPDHVSLLAHAITPIRTVDAKSVVDR
jgi:hypothetical protein